MVNIGKSYLIFEIQQKYIYMYNSRIVKWSSRSIKVHMLCTFLKEKKKVEEKKDQFSNTYLKPTRPTADLYFTVKPLLHIVWIQIIHWHNRLCQFRITNSNHCNWSKRSLKEWYLTSRQRKFEPFRLFENLTSDLWH